MFELGFIRLSSSPWTFPSQMVPTSSGDWRPCWDCKALSRVTVLDGHPILCIKDVQPLLSGCRLFSRIHLVGAHNPIHLGEADVLEVALTNAFGLFEFVWMPFGLSNAIQALKRFMHRMTRGLKNMYVYLDDTDLYATLRSNNSFTFATFPVKLCYTA